MRCTLPQGAANMFGGPKSAPAVASLTLNPIMGYVRTAYTARIDDDLLLCTRFDLNVFSFESDLALGAEYNLRRTPDEDTYETASSLRERVGVWTMPGASLNVSLRDRESSSLTLPAPTLDASAHIEQSEETPGESVPSKHASSTSAALPTLVSKPSPELRSGTSNLSSSPSSSRSLTSSTSPSHTLLPALASVEPPATPATSLFLGLLKARISTSGIFSLLWEGHWRRCLVSVGLQSNLLSHAVSNLGVEIKYLSDT